MEDSKQIKFSLLVDGITQAQQQLDKFKTTLADIGKTQGSKGIFQKDTVDIQNAERAAKSYESQLARLRQLGAKSFMTGDTAGFDKYKAQFTDLNTRLIEFNKQWGIWNKGFYDSSNLWDYSLSKARSHLLWLGSGFALGALADLPAQLMQNAKTVEEQLGKTRQNMELSPVYRDNVQQLDSDMEHLKNTAMLFSVAYGASIGEVMESMQLLSRRYKDLPTIQLLENLVLTLHKIDFLPIREGSRLIEAVANQFQLSADGIKQFVNETTVATHSYNILTTDLLSAMQRSGSAMKQFGFDTRTAIALISVLSNASSKAGGEIGQSLRSITMNLDYPKMKKALDELGISVYDAENKVRPGIEVLEDMFRRFGQLDEKSQNAFSILTGGGKFQGNSASILLNQANMIREAYTKLGEASDSLTASLLATRLDTYASRLEQLSSAWQVFSTTLGYEALPALKNLVWHLSEGLQALTNHREEVGKAVNGIALLTEAFILSRGATMFWGATMGTATGQAISAQIACGNLRTGIVALMSNFYGLAAGIAGAAGRLVVFIGLAQILNNLIGGYQASKAAEDMESRIHDERKHADRGGLSEETKQDIELLEKRNALLQEQKSHFLSGHSSTLNDDYRRVNNELDAVNDAIAGRNRISTQMGLIKKVGEVNPKDTTLTYDKTPGGNEYVDFSQPKGSGAARDPYRLDNLAVHRAMNDAFTAAKLSADAFQESLDNLSIKEKLYGLTAAQALEKAELRIERQKELTSEQETYVALADDYKQAAQEMIDKDAGITEAMQKYGLTLKDLGKEDYRTLIQDNNHLSKLIDAYNRLTEAASKAGKEVNKITGEIIQMQYGHSLNPYERSNDRLRAAHTEGTVGTAYLDKTAPGYYEQANAIKIKELTSAYKEYALQLNMAQEELERYRNSSDKTTEQMQEQEKKVDDLKAKTAQSYRAMADAAEECSQNTKKFYADTIGDLIIEGKTGEQILIGIMKNLAKEVINQMLGVNKTGASLLSTIGGKGKSSKGKGSTSLGVAGSSSSFRTATANNLLSTWHTGGIVTPKYHTGGIVIPKFHNGTDVVPHLQSSESLAILEAGEEVNSRSQRRSNEIMADIIKEMAKNQGNTVVQISAVDSKSFVEYMDQHGDILVNLLRKQKSMGNGI